MSLESWKKEYYPVDADEVDAKDACAHSTQKWTGMLKKNLRRHALYAIDGKVSHKGGGDVFSVSGATCALCCVHEAEDETCDGCPLFMVRGRIPCDAFRDDERDGDDTIFGTFIESGDARPMLVWLRRAQRWEQDQAIKKLGDES